MPELITLYTSKICPFAHRSEIALAEAKAGFTRFEIDLHNKPDWYASQVNPASKVPTLAYGGPQVPPEQPSPESDKIVESLIVVEFVADAFPESKIMPTDPVERAKARFFIDLVSTKFVPAWIGALFGGKPFAPFWEALEAIQAALPADKTYAIGNEYSAADISITPFLARMEIALKEDTGAFPAGEGTKAAEIFFSGDRFARLVRYFDALKARESFKTFDAEWIKAFYRKRFAERTASHH
ncbi:glutathione S-transferase [Mycena latifolia]|nr:glutathione S-transferase [Mycena latifolia]